MDTREHTKKLANDIRTKIYGKEVREALATGIEESGNTSQEARDITESLLNGSYDTGLLNTEIEQRMNNLYSTKGQAMDDLYTQKNTELTDLYINEKSELDTLQADYADRAETLETTYAPRLTTAEQDITKNHQEVTAQLAQTERTFSENKPSTYRHRDRRPVVTFLDDDGKKEVYTRLRPIFNDKNVPLSMAIITNRLDNMENTMTSDEVKTMIAEGHEALGHTHDAHSPNMTVVSEEYLINDLIENRKQLAKLGSDSRGFVYPGNQGPKWVREITQNHFDFSFGAYGINHDDNIDPMNIKRVAFGNWGSGADLEKYKNDVDAVIDSGGWLVFMLHVGTGNTPEEELAILPDLIDYIKSKDIEIVNASEGYEIHGSKIFIGDKEGKYLNITGDKVFGNLDIEMEGSTNLITLPRNSKSSNDEIESYPAGQSFMYVTNTFSLNDGGFPIKWGGVIITYRIGNAPEYDFQIYHVYNSNEVYKRYADEPSKWSDWAKIYPNTIPYISDTPNSKTNETPPTSFEDGKITYTDLTLGHMATAGFPTDRPALLITDSFLSGYGRQNVRQQLKRSGAVDVWERVALTSSTWTSWSKII